MLPRLIGVTAVLLAAYVAYLSLLFVVQRRVMYPGAQATPRSASPEAIRHGVESLWLSTSSGEVEAWYLPAASTVERGPAAVVFHGNAELALDSAAVLAHLSELGVAALYVEYPGYGRSAGSPSENSIVDAATVGYDWLVARPDVDSERVFALGRSLGAGVAAGLAQHRPVAALVLWSPFVSVGYLALRSYGAPPFLARDRYDTRRVLSTFGRPVLIFHGNRDQVIPYHHATVLAAAGKAATLVSWDCGHNDCPPSWRELWDPLTSFLQANRLLGHR